MQDRGTVLDLRHREGESISLCVHISVSLERRNIRGEKETDAIGFGCSVDGVFNDRYDPGGSFSDHK